LHIELPAFDSGEAMDPRFAFCRIDPDQHVALSANRNPELRWKDAPDGTRSFVLLCYDRDVPNSAEDVNQEGREIPPDLPRVDFFHWVLVDISPQRHSIAEGAASDGVTARGKSVGSCEFGIRGINNYTNWFADDPEMSGNYGGYDGPCPPWNDSIVHHYHFCLYALDVSTLGLGGHFGGVEVREAMEGHILDEAQWIGVYSLNPELQG
jgi:Raf kinase inhibitor-like YbhB/YbcL family protein